MTTRFRPELAGILLAVTLLGIPAQAQKVEFSPAALQSLQARWDWAGGARGEVMVGWSVPGASTGWHNRNQGPTLADLVGGETDSPPEAAILVRVSDGEILGVHQYDMRSNLRKVDTLFWLGSASQSSSFNLLTGLEVAGDAERGLLYALGVHDTIPEAGQRLRAALRSEREGEYRKAAAYALAAHSGREAVAQLHETGIGDSIIEVAKAACYALGSIDHIDAVVALEGIVLQSDHLETRKAAVYALGNQGGDRARAFLLSLIDQESQ